jgi:pSer/pThr/pTyr-binding forkhead associated (FHA) protein
MTKTVIASVFDGSQHIHDYQFEQDVITIGRDTSNSIVLSNLAVSALHAMVDLSSMTLTDLGSINGTFLGERQIATAPFEYSRPFKIGEYRIVVAEYSPTNRHGDDAITANLKRSSLSLNRYGDHEETLVLKRSPLAGSGKEQVGDIVRKAPIEQRMPMKTAGIVALVVAAMIVGYQALLTVL